jgi:ABC-type branched-subunit amino acid transport system ATPase component
MIRGGVHSAGSSQAATADPTSAALRVEGLSKRFGGLTAVDEASFDVAPGRITSLIGPNGAGKTTVFNLLTGGLRPDSGRVRLFGEDVTGHSPSRLVARGLGRTFQEPRAFIRLTALENVMVGAYRRGPRSTLRARALDALELVGLRDVARQPAGHLPYGDQKLLAVARLLAADVSVLLLDEPAAGIGADDLERLLALFSSLREAGRTLLLVEHNMEAVMGVSDHVVVLDFGRRIAAGTPAVITANQDVIRVYLGVS